MMNLDDLSPGTTPWPQMVLFVRQSLPLAYRSPTWEWLISVLGKKKVGIGGIFRWNEKVDVERWSKSGLGIEAADHERNTFEGQRLNPMGLEEQNQAPRFIDSPKFTGGPYLGIFAQQLLHSWRNEWKGSGSREIVAEEWAQKQVPRTYLEVGPVDTITLLAEDPEESMMACFRREHATQNQLVSRCQRITHGMSMNPSLVFVDHDGSLSIVWTVNGRAT